MRRLPVLTLFFWIALHTAWGCKDRDPPGDTARWQQVLAWARPTVRPANAALLEYATGLVTAIAPGAESATAAGARGQRAHPRDRSGAAVSALRKWYETRGGLPKRPKVMRLLPLVRAALKSATGPAQLRQVEAVLYLAHRLRAEGFGAAKSAAGYRFAVQAAEWLRSHQAKPSTAFRRYAPRPEQRFRALAAEAVSAVQLARRSVIGQRKTGTDLSPLRGELAAARRYWEDLVHGARSLMGDAKRLRAFLSETNRRARRGPHLVRVVAIRVNPILDRLKHDADRYAQLVLGQP